MSPTVLVVDIGGNNVKMRLSSSKDKLKFSSGPELTPSLMVEQIKQLTADWQFDRITMGYPGPVRGNRVLKEPHNLGPGWLEHDFQADFEQPLRLVSDAAIQALGLYDGGKMLFLGLGTGLGATLVVSNFIVPLEIAHMPYKDDKSFEDFVGKRGLDRLGKRDWREVVIHVASILKDAFVADYIVFGGGNAKRLRELPDWCRLGSNDHAFIGGFNIWLNDDLHIF